MLKGRTVLNSLFLSTLTVAFGVGIYLISEKTFLEKNIEAFKEEFKKRAEEDFKAMGKPKTYKKASVGENAYYNFENGSDDYVDDIYVFVNAKSTLI